MNINDIDSKFRADFYDVINRCSGKTELYLTLISNFDNKGIKLVSRKNTIDANMEEFSRFIAFYPNIIKKVNIKI
jgi:hypothetical protein